MGCAVIKESPGDLGTMVNMLTTSEYFQPSPLDKLLYSFVYAMPMTLEGYDGLERVLFHYDVAGDDRSTAARVCQIVFGRARGGGPPGRPPRLERGFIHRPGVVWIGQSVLVLPPPDAEELATRLSALAVRISMARIPISRGALEAFRRRGVV